MTDTYWAELRATNAPIIDQLTKLRTIAQREALAMCRHFSKEPAGYVLATPTDTDVADWIDGVIEDVQYRELPEGFSLPALSHVPVSSSLTPDAVAPAEWVTLWREMGQIIAAFPGASARCYEGARAHLDRLATLAQCWADERARFMASHGQEG